ncbi:helix-turn-helix domain-containing protein [Streptococcus suis]|uniref:helix-turn-helix domain-containing protein n=2 Tax=Streptococcus suis TaxID=1307 RepID=UPI00040341D8|nr:helix-turn-helix transcriptional regulator [Streptococcus suis]
MKVTPEILSSVHNIGPHFREMRIKRGLSIKEAARDIVSPQFLSQFEKGKKGISVENFSRLLISIGLDWIDWADTYRGDRSESYTYFTFELTEHNDHNYAKSLPKVREAMKHHNLDNPELKELAFNLISLVSQAGSTHFDKKEKLIQQVKLLLERASFYNTLETDLFNIFIEELPYKLVRSLEIIFLDNYLNNYSLNCIHNFHYSLVSIVKYYRNREYYLEAQRLIDNIRTEHTEFQHRFVYETIELEIQEIFLWLQQNKVEAIPKARKIIDFYDNMRALSSNCERFILGKHTFIEQFNQYNKTGFDLYGPEI